MKLSTFFPVKVFRGEEWNFLASMALSLGAIVFVVWSFAREGLDRGLADFGQLVVVLVVFELGRRVGRREKRIEGRDSSLRSE